MEKQGHLERVRERQRMLNQMVGFAPTDYARIDGALTEAIIQAGNSGASIDEIRTARTIEPGAEKR